ncbi:MAG: dephospho-CoA kinase [Nocardioidaceae bacterium]
MMRVALTGGIGSGKTTVSDFLAELGAVVIDADVLSREVVAAGTPGLAEIVVAFGPDVLTPDGELDRPAMGARVFGDDAARQRLESIIHPRVRARAAAIEAAAPPDAVVVHVIPLLVETGQGAAFDEVVVVDVPPAVQSQRLERDRGMTSEQVAARVAAQATREERLAAATQVVVNAGTPAQLREAVEKLWTRLQSLSTR